MALDKAEAHTIIAELRRMHDEVRSLISDAADKARLSAGGPDALKDRLVILKQDIKV